MYCSQCGSALTGDEKFCHKCGNYISSAETPYREFPLQNIPAPGRSRAPALIVVVLMLSAGASGAVYYVNNNYDPFEADEFVFYGSGAVGKGVISIFSDPDDTDPYDDIGMVTLTCNAYSLGGYSWTLRSLSDVTNINNYPISENITTSSDGKSLICTLEPGYYYVKVNTEFRTYEGTFALGGEISRAYEWTYVEYASGTTTSHSFNLDFNFQYKDCISAIDYNGKRGYFYFSKIESALNGFVSEDSPIITELELKLREEYDKKLTSEDYILSDPGNRYNYASYLLCFVQQTVTYASDANIYGSEEYWAFPTQTLVQGYGDCEDSSILCAALYKTAGYDTAMAVLPGHAMAGVYISGESVYSSSYLPYPYDEQGSRPIYGIYQEVDGKIYYGCEATDSSSKMLIGYTNLTHTETVNGEVRSGTLMDWVPNEKYSSENSYGFYVITG